MYDVALTIEEGKKFSVGLIRILGNTSTRKNVILRESLLVPGETFDLRKLRATQKRLEAIGYFKSVNVYPVKTPEDQTIGDDYRDVVIEVDETTTGSVNLFFGFSKIDDLFGGLEIAERNFNHRGLLDWWRKGSSALRGGGEYVHIHTQVGKKQQSYKFAWVDPYFKDSLWRFGFDVHYSRVAVQSDDYHVHGTGGSIFVGHPLSFSGDPSRTCWSYGLKTRIKNSIVHIQGIEGASAQRERDNSGVIVGVKNSLTYNSTDNPFKPHRGFFSTLDGEIAGVRRHGQGHSRFCFVKLEYLNSYYYPLWRRGTLKLRLDLKRLYPIRIWEAIIIATQ